MTMDQEQFMGMYDPSFEKDSCGIGFVANLKGKKSHEVIKDSLTMLENMEHRGGCGCENNTGDGAGILIQIPHTFYKHISKDLRIALPDAGEYGTGITFFPKNIEKKTRCKELVKEVALKLNMHILGWRILPTDNSSVGPTALSAEPSIEQIFVQPDYPVKDQDELERKLFVFRNLVTHTIHKEVEGTKDFFYFTSLSCKTIIYKGQLTTWQVSPYFEDLRNPEAASAIALVHSRFSTNTFPKWKLAQPFRYLAHNGEINTIKGNVNWMRTKESLMESSLFTKEELKLILPICDPEQSDSANLDNVVELLYLSGRSLPHALMMLIPEAWQDNDQMPDYKKAFYEYHDCLFEPWDGPASICFTDGKIVGATLDRNGLRPSRYVLTSDDKLIMSSEAGSLPVDQSKVILKGRLQPGRMFIANLEEGRIISDEELKMKICSEHPYREWLTKNKITFSDLPQSPIQEEVLQEKGLFEQQQAFGYTTEDIRVIITPMAETAYEPLRFYGYRYAISCTL
jgi:glutamate synthase (NADPH) large chain